MASLFSFSLRAFWGLGFLLSANACTDDAASSRDAGMPAASQDAGSSHDGGIPAVLDAGVALDAGTRGNDAGSRSLDGGSSVNPDAGTQGSDAGIPQSDAGAGGSPTIPVTTGYGASPARCGQADYQWLTGSALGEVLSDEETNALSAFAINLIVGGLENAGKISFAHSPQYDVKVHRVRYQTQDRGHLIDATGFMGIPEVDAAQELPVLLFLHGTEGMADVCSPTRAPQIGGDTFANAQLIGLLASLGYIVVAPDFIGMKSLGDPSPDLHPYLVGEPTAIASLDMVRAAQRLVPQVEPNLSLGPIVVDGASQGGHASAFVTRFFPHYAPELNLVAAVWGIPPTNLRRHVNIALAAISAPTSNTVAWALGANAWYSSDPNGLASIFVSPYDVDLPAYARQNCNLDILDGVTQLDQVFTTEVLAAASAPGLAGYAPWDCMVDESSMPTTSVPHQDDLPVLFVIGSDDGLVNPQIERDSFTTLCGQGYDMEYLECSGAGHTQGYLYSLDDQFDWIEARLAGTPMPANSCTLTPAVICSSTP